MISEAVRSQGREPAGTLEPRNPGRASASLFPVFLKLAGRTCVVVGAGRIGEEKIGALLAAGAAVRVVAPEVRDAVLGWAHEGFITLAQRPYQPADLDGAFLVVVATASPELNRSIFCDANQRRILCNVVDDPPHCDFYYPSVVRRGDLQIAISTNGRSPALAQRLRRQLERQFGPVYETWLEHLGRARQRLFQSRIDPEARRKLLHRLASEDGFEEFVKGASVESRGRAG